MNSIPKIVMVSYLNSKPFEYGISNSGVEISDFDIHLAHPADCASMFEEGKADIALLPVGALQEMDDYKIISDFCIACDGEVRTVCLFSDYPIETWSNVYLDSHSRTSVLLTKVLLEQFFGKKPYYKTSEVNSVQLGVGDAILMIGDKVFDIENNYKYKYDLGKIWKDWTGLPFVFAVWVAKPYVNKKTIHSLNQKLAYGIKNIDTVISNLNSESLALLSYFKNNIKYDLAVDQRKAIDLFEYKCTFLKEKAKILP
ncbi:MAG: menaquinone biosynthesis protein [Saprospiraceae bacterium]|nr:menaquinone biosynthesis protein [Saprospiraceae bacterium]